MAWIRRSIASTGGRGSAHHYSPLWGWGSAYPETTGYLTPTLLHYADLLQDDSLRTLALQCRDWLLGTQLPCGAWNSGTAGGTQPSLFNTAMILWGTTPSREAARAVAWLLSSLSPDGAWRNTESAYVPGFVPSYYTYAVWSVLEAGTALERTDVLEKMRSALHFYADRFQADGTIADWGLKPGSSAFTHTIAYTLQGFWESALLLGEPIILEKTVRSAEGLVAELERTHRVAGRYGPGWRGDYSFTCPVGSAQLSIFFRRLGASTGEARYTRAAAFLLNETLRFQSVGKNANTHGALPGSVPFWGPYMRWKYPNWGAKFLLDALVPRP